MRLRARTAPSSLRHLPSYAGLYTLLPCGCGVSPLLKGFEGFGFTHESFSVEFLHRLAIPIDLEKLVVAFSGPDCAQCVLSVRDRSSRITCP